MDELAPWDGWELVVFDAETGQFICRARNRVEFLERLPAPVSEVHYGLRWEPTGRSTPRL